MTSYTKASIIMINEWKICLNNLVVVLGLRTCSHINLGVF